MWYVTMFNVTDGYNISFGNNDFSLLRIQQDVKKRVVIR